jgi:hypothetical protein
MSKIIENIGKRLLASMQAANENLVWVPSETTPPQES